jgi:DNA-binding CsgD family transcriptional regulator
MDTSDRAGAALDGGRAAFARRAWAEAFERLSEADAARPLPPEELDRLATAAYLAGRDAESAETRARAHQGFLADGRPEAAIRCAFWLGFGLLMKGEHARGGGWIARARRLLDELEGESPFHGYVLLPEALRTLGQGDAGAAHDLFARAARIGERFDEVDLVSLGRLGRGQALIRQGRIPEGVELLDEAMVAVETDELSPVVSGTIYCAVIETCREIFDLRRAGEWTDALGRWCASQPELVPFRGQCLVRRAEIMELQGAWTNAMQEAREACERLAAPPGEPAAGSAYYRTAELHRLRGELAEAEDAYAEAAAWGAETQPGLGLLRLAQGRTEAACAALGLAVDGARNPAARARLLPALVEATLEAGDLPAAREAAEALADIGRSLEAPFVSAAGARALGSVLLAEGEARASLELLREAFAGWEQLEAPYEAARTRVLVGRACRALGDGDSCEMEMVAARRVFERLGAEPDLRRLDALAGPAPPSDRHGLSRRELQVLRRIAAGESNREIAGALFISERTVERHASNIFRKLRVSSRAAATAFAYEHDLV